MTHWQLSVSKWRCVTWWLKRLLIFKLETNSLIYCYTAWQRVGAGLGRTCGSNCWMSCCVAAQALTGTLRGHLAQRANCQKLAFKTMASKETCNLHKRTALMWSMPAWQRHSKSIWGEDEWRKWDVSAQIYYIICVSWGEFVLIISASRRLFLFFLPIVPSPILISHFLSSSFFFLGAVLCSQGRFFLALERLFMDSSMKPYYICVRLWARERETEKEK